MTVNVNEDHNLVEIKAENEYGFDEDAIDIVREIGNKPSVKIIQPRKESTMENRINVQARTMHVPSKSVIKFLLNGRTFSDFTFNTSRNEIKAVVSLLEGKNVLSIEVTNADGKDIDVREIVYIKNIIQPLGKPKVSIESPKHNATLKQAEVELMATVLRVSRKNDLALKINGNKTNQFQFNTSNGKVTARLTLKPGENKISLKGSNKSGSDEEEVKVTYSTSSLMPTVDIILPQNNSSTDKSDVAFRANTSHISAKSQIKLLINGQTVENFSFSGGKINLGAKT